MAKKEPKISISPIALKRLESYYHNTKIEEIYFGVNEIHLYHHSEYDGMWCYFKTDYAHFTEAINTKLKSEYKKPSKNN